MLQADPVVQDPNTSQSFNRYSYVHNNPLSFTDPTGYFSLRQLVAAIVFTVVAIFATPLGPFFAGFLAGFTTDQDHWLTAGVKPEVIGMVTGSQIYTPIKLDKGKNVAWFKGADELLVSGYLWEENRQQLAYKPFLIHQPRGKGHDHRLYPRTYFACLFRWPAGDVNQHPVQKCGSFG